MSAVVSARAGRIQTGVPYALYAQLAGANITTLKTIEHSPKHYLHRLAHPKETAPLTLGIAAHTAVLEPDKFAATYAVWDLRSEKTGKLRPRNGKDYDAFAAANDGKKVLKEDEQVRAMAIQAAVRTHAPAMHYLRRGQPEVSMEWIDDETGIACRGRVDWLTTDGGCPVLVGLKTARDIRPRQFSRQAANLGYAEQWAFYADGHRAITGRMPKVVEVVVESADPFDVGVYLVRDDTLEHGRTKYREMLHTLAECQRTDTWPGALPGETHFELPPWAYEPDEDEDADAIEGVEVKGNDDE